MMPSILYKYKPISSYLLNSLKEESAWFAKPSTFNDPFDCQLKFTSESQFFRSLVLYQNIFGINSSNVLAFTDIVTQQQQQGFSEVEIIHHIESLLASMGSPTVKEQIDDYLDSLQAHISEIGILSLAENNDDLLMWAHYAYEHKGICLGFSTTECHPSAPGNWLSDIRFTRPVKYGTFYPSLLDLKLFDTSQDELKDNLLFYKSKAWEYEKEWRCILDPGDELHPFPGKLESIIFGAKIKPSDINDVVNSIADYGYKPKFFQAIIREDKFALEIVPL